MLAKITKIFVVTFLLNTVWEFLHSKLYVVYQGGEITNFILLRAAFWDAVILTVIACFFIRFEYLKNRKWLVVPIGLAIAFLIEVYALNTHRWEYNQFMPIVPVLSVGLTPFVQLALTGFLAFLFII